MQPTQCIGNLVWLQMQYMPLLLTHMQRKLLSPYGPPKDPNPQSISKTIFYSILFHAMQWTLTEQGINYLVAWHVMWVSA